MWRVSVGEHDFPGKDGGVRMSHIYDNCPYEYPERDGDCTLSMCRLHPEKIWGVEEKDCMDCPKCPDKDWQAWKHSLHETERTE